MKHRLKNIVGRICLLSKINFDGLKFRIQVLCEKIY